MVGPMNTTQEPSSARCLASGKTIPAASFVRIGCVLLLLFIAAPRGAAAQPFARLEPADTPGGYLARLLINEVPFPGENAYESEADTRAAMFEILWVLNSRIHHIPAGYTQRQVAGVSSDNIIDVITGTGGRRQCEGFYRDAQGRFVTAARVEDRVNNLLRIANSGGQPGRFAGLINYAQDLARAYCQDGIQGADRYAGLQQIGAVPVTGHAYSWMTDIDSYNPGGNFVTITAAYDGELGGNRFFTLRKHPK